MMIQENYLSTLAKPVKQLIGLFLLVLTCGYFAALVFVNDTTSSDPEGIIENYNGNEDNEDAEIMKFKKSKHEMLNIIHTHILSMSIIFFILGFLVYGTSISRRLKYFLMIEPLLSVLLTFGGIYLIWLGFEWMTYVVMISGTLMTASVIASSIAIIHSMFIAPYVK